MDTAVAVAVSPALFTAATPPVSVSFMERISLNDTLPCGYTGCAMILLSWAMQQAPSFIPSGAHMSSTSFVGTFSRKTMNDEYLFEFASVRVTTTCTRNLSLVPSLSVTSLYCRILESNSFSSLFGVNKNGSMTKR